MNSLLELFNKNSYLRMLTSDDRKFITECCVRYMFKIDGLPALKENLNEYGLPSEEWRLKLRDSSEAAKIKIWLRYISKYPNANIAKSIGIDPKNKPLKSLVKNGTDLQFQINAIKGVVFSWDKMQQVMARALVDIEPHIKRRAYTKLRFLSDAAHDLSDFHSELASHVISGIYSQYPRYKTYEHLCNVGRRIVNNQSINIINYHTGQCRRAKYAVGDGTYDSHKVSLEALTEGRASDEAVTSDYSRSVDSDLQAQLDIDFGLGLTGYLDSDKKIRAYQLLMEIDPDFSAWLVKKRYTKMTDNIKCQDRLISTDNQERYMEYIAEYLGIDPYKFIKFFKDMAVEILQPEI